MSPNQLLGHLAVFTTPKSSLTMTSPLENATLFGQHLIKGTLEWLMGIEKVA